VTKRSVRLADCIASLAELAAACALCIAWPSGDAQDGVRVRKLPLGRVLAETSYRDGRRHGRATRFWLSGGKRRECEYRNGVREGRATAWYRNGLKRYVGEYKNGAQTGEWFYFKRDGKLDGPRTGMYENGLRYAAMKGFNDWNA
jgi:antitoxin component YwqK of YwqJK toxin-antitoxin module